MTIDKPGQEQRMELKPCRACGKPCRVEVYGPNAAIQEPMGLWICSNTSRVGGDCPDPNAYLSAEAWNTRPTADLGEDGELVERLATGKRKCPGLEPTLTERPHAPNEWRELGRQAADRLILYREALTRLSDSFIGAWAGMYRERADVIAEVERIARDVLSRSA